MAIIEPDNMNAPQKTKLYKNPSYKKQSKYGFIQSKASSDQFWKRKFMQVLEAMHDTELSWARENWSAYGISDHEAKVIEKEFERQQEWRAKREGKNFNN